MTIRSRSSLPSRSRLPGVPDARLHRAAQIREGDRQRRVLAETDRYRPVQIRGVEEGEHLIVEANQDYWKDSPKGMPKIKTIVFRTIPETTTQIAELLSGGVDIIRNGSADQIEVVKSSSNAGISATKILRVNSLVLDSAGVPARHP